MNTLTPTRAANVLAIAFLAPGVLGFLPNPIVGAGGLFETNVAHNFVHLATALAFFLVARMGDSASTTFMRVFGVVYMLVGIVGFVVLGGAERGMLLGLIHINALDNYLHVGLSAGILALSSLATAAPANVRAS